MLLAASDAVADPPGALDYQRSLAAADRMAVLGRLVAGFSHEINNPSNSIQLNAQVLAGAWQDVVPILDQYQLQHGDFLVGGLEYREMREAVASLIADIAEGAERIRRISTELRDFARADVSDMRRSVDLNEVVGSSLRLFASTTARATRHLEVRLAEGMPSVRGNPHRLGQVFIDLLSNACQALPTRDRAIRIETGVTDGAVWLQVADEGVGIAPENRERVFDPFFTVARPQLGSGLGLAACLGIVREHGGEILLESSQGVGTTVRVLLPSSDAAP